MAHYGYPQNSIGNLVGKIGLEWSKNNTGNTVQWRPEFLDEIQTNLKSFAPCYSQSPQLCLEILFIQTHATSDSFSTVQLLYLVHCKGERRKTWQKTTPPFLWFRKSIQKPQKSENSQDCAQKPLRKCTFMNSVSVLGPGYGFFTEREWESFQLRDRCCLWGGGGWVGGMNKKERVQMFPSYFLLVCDTCRCMGAPHMGGTVQDRWTERMILIIKNKTELQDN